MDSLWVIIAAYNEEKNIAAVLEKTKKYAKNIVVVDDGSRDDTYDVAKREGVTVLRHILNLGKGAAVRTGVEYAIAHGAGKIVLMDADGQHLPEDIPHFAKELGKVDFVFGYREFNKTMPFILRFGNNFLNWFSRFLFGISVKDTQSGYRAFRASVYDKIKWKTNRYAMESEVVFKVSKNKLSYSEISIKTIYSDRYKGTTVFDGIRNALRMLSLRLRG